MRYLVILVVLSIWILQATTPAAADTIAHRAGLSGRLGAAVPFENDMIKGTSKTRAGLIGGGGLIYGFDDHFAAEVEASHVPNMDVEAGGVKSFEASFTDVSVGFQYRFLPQQRLVPFLGAGADFIHGNLDNVSGAGYRLDWAYGGHINAGFDWFVNRSIALTVEIRGVMTADADVRAGSVKVSEYSPRWVQGAVGFRLLLPEHF
jgi:outer membrane protein